jgi:hypothetical protein
MALSMTTDRVSQVAAALQQRRLLKAIAGINNGVLHRIEALVRTANRVAATQPAMQLAVDMQADAALVAAIRPQTTLPLFASSVSPQALAQALAAGADVAELGNYDALYTDGQFFDAAQVLELTQQTLALLPAQRLCVTVPGHLHRDAQARLAQQLTALGVLSLQTEGAARLLGTPPRVQALLPEEKLALTLENTRVLRAAVATPVLTASGLSTAPDVALALAAGACGVGVGSALMQLASAAPDDDDAMYALLVAMAAEAAPVVAKSVRPQSLVA